MKLDVRGFSLLEVIVAMGMFCILMGGVTSVTTHMSKEIDRSTARGEFERVADYAHQILKGSPVTCAEAIRFTSMRGLDGDFMRRTSIDIDSLVFGSIDLLALASRGAWKTKAKIQKIRAEGSGNVYSALLILDQWNVNAPVAPRDGFQMVNSTQATNSEIGGVRTRQLPFFFEWDPQNERIVACAPDRQGLRVVAPTGMTSFLVRHSQTVLTPECPAGFNTIRTGYSFLMMTGAGTGGGQSLGSPGSCMQHFRPVPFTECVGNGGPSGTGSCDFSTGSDWSYWLSSQTVDEGRVSGALTEARVSRCAVCEAPVTTMAVHSQTAEVPSCPEGWNSLWSGYSFMTSFGGGGSATSMQDLSSPGSCLEKFRPMPFLECQNDGSCEYFTASDYSYWMSTQTVDEPRVSGAAMEARVGRCSVCAKTP